MIRYPIDRREPLQILALSLAIVVVVLVSGLLFFRSTERTFADVI
jgi:ABC-type polysaccharide/polyol phosphate export permease